MSNHGYNPSFQSSNPPDGTMDLFIETLTGTAFEMTVSPFDTVISIKSKIQRVEGIPVSHQHLLYNMIELKDSDCLIDYSINNGATLKLVLSMRGGPISTRRLPAGDDLAWRELRDFVESNREDMFDQLPPGCRVTVLVFRDGDQVNLFRVIENEDGTYSPLSESWSGSAIRNLFTEEDPDETAKKLHENSVTMGKMQELKIKMEQLALQKKPKKASAPHGVSAKRPLLHTRRATPRPHNADTNDPGWQSSMLVLPPIKQSDQPVTSNNTYLASSSLLQPKQLLPRRRRESDNRLKTGDHSNLQPPDNMASALRMPRVLSSSVQPAGPRRAPRRASNTTVLPDVTPLRQPDLKLDNKSGTVRKSKPVGNEMGVAGGVVSSIVEDTDLPSKEATTLAISRERVVSGGHNHYRVSHLVLGEDDRPKTSPDNMNQEECSTTELNGTTTRWQYQQAHCSNTQLDNAGRTRELSSLLGQYTEQDRELRDFLTHLTEPGRSKRGSVTSPLDLRLGSPLVDVAVRSPPYGRRSVMLPATPVMDRYQQELELRPLRQHRRRVSSSEQTEVLVPVGELEPPPTRKRQTRPRCTECRKRLNITNAYTCRCEKLFCSSHRYSELHGCTFDYKTEGRKLIEQANPLVTAPKLPKI